MSEETNDWVNVGGRAGRGAVLPAGRGIGRKSDAAGRLRIVTRGIAGPVGVRDDADCSVGAMGRAEGIRMIGESVMPRGSLESRLRESESDGT